MQHSRVEQTDVARLRIIFSDTVVSLSLTANATLGDIAQTLGEFLPRPLGDPIAIDVTLPLAHHSARLH